VGLERIFYLHGEGMVDARHLAHDRSLCEGVLEYFLLVDFLLRKDFHRVQLLGRYFFHQEHLTEGACPQQLVCNEVLSANNIFLIV
jgi:hypothetical protein